MRDTFIEGSSSDERMVAHQLALHPRVDHAGQASRGVAHVADTMALLAYATYTSCTMFNCLTIKLTDVPVVGSVVEQTYVPVALALLAVSIMLRGRCWTPVGTIGIVCAATIILLSGMRSGYWDLAYAFLILLAVGGMDYARLSRVLMWELLVTLAACLISTKALGYPEWWDLLDGGFVSGRGAYHPNLYSFMLFCATLCIALIVDRRRLFWPLLATVMVCAAFSYVVQHSDTALVAFICLAAALVVERVLPGLAAFVCRPRFFASTSVTMILGMALFVLVLVAVYSPDNKVAVLIDRILHSRIRLPASYYHEYGGYSLLGGPIRAWTGSASAARMGGIPLAMLDSAYSLYALRSGLAATACILAIFSRACHVIGRTGPSLLLWAAFAIMAACMVMEFTPAFLCLNCTLPYLAEGLRPRAEVA